MFMELLCMFEESKSPDMSVYKWQLPVKQSNIMDKDWIYPRANYHCFDSKGFSLCGKYWQDIYFFETDLERNKSRDDLEDCKCKKCKKIFFKLQSEGRIGENIGGKRKYRKI